MQLEDPWLLLRCTTKFGNGALISVASRPCSSADALAQRAQISANAGGVDAIVAAPLAAGRAYVNAAAGLVPRNSDDDIVGEAEPAGLLTSLDGARVGIRGDDRPARHRFRNQQRFVECARHRQCGQKRG